ncbi:MAG TPA: hypothetical protein VIS06_15510 [Mycobacteriales bacterium]|jgi:hypothetical protein
MPALGEYADVYDTAIAVLEQKGFTIWKDEAADMFCAQRDGWDFMGDSPISLLGLVAIYEHKNPTSYVEYWWRTAPTRASGSIPTTPPEYEPVWQKH